MKLSEAIRKGSIGVSQITGELIFWEDGKAVGCCALGAAIIGAELTQPTGHKDKYILLRERFPELVKNIMSPRGFEYELENIIIRLNDTHGWTFDQIANWLEENGL